MLTQTDDPEYRHIVNMPAGQKHVYHRGCLAIDREGDSVRAKQVKATAKAMYKAYQLGLVHLLQERVGPNKFEYIVVRR